MELKLTRRWFTQNSTIGELTVDGAFLCFVLEPNDKGLTSDMDLDTIKAKKVWGHTAIPTGTYPLLMITPSPTFTSHFKWLPADTMFPELQNVPDFSAVMIHPGNYPKDTEGCSLVGMTRDIDMVGSTVGAFQVLGTKTFAAIKAGGVTYTIERDSDAWEKFTGVPSNKIPISSIPGASDVVSGNNPDNFVEKLPETNDTEVPYKP